MYMKLYVMDITGEGEELTCQPGDYRSCCQQNDSGTWGSQFREIFIWQLEVNIKGVGQRVKFIWFSKLHMKNEGL